MKRYAIVRVDDAKEGIKWLDILDEIVKKRKIIIDYGDTKEQLIRKVAQVLRTKYWTDKKDATWEDLAKEIVEFLGVEE